MCKYCNGTKHMLSRANDNLYLEVYSDSLRLLGRVNQTDIKKEYKIKHCPMCGIKLREIKEEEE